VVEYHVLVSPHETRTTDQVVDATEKLVDERVGREGAVVGVVLDGETVNGEENTQERTQNDYLIDYDELPEEEGQSE